MRCLPLGAPPRVRGKVGDVGVALAVVGITPAYAGKSPLRYRPVRMRRDHPRVCGEKLGAKEQPRRKPGSPPRVRGKDFRNL